MAKHNKQEEPHEEGDEEEEMTEVEFQNKVIRVMKELKADKKHVNTLEDELKTKREHVLNLKIKIEESLKKELKEINKERETLEAEIIYLRRVVKNRKALQNYANISRLYMNSSATSDHAVTRLVFVTKKKSKRIQVLL